MEKTMRNLRQFFERVRSRHGNRGSALLVSLMVMVGLSLLGLSFVAISETETAIAGHQRDSQQSLDVAEAATNAAVQWFQDPQWCTATAGILPNNDASIKQVRTITNYSDVYKPNAASLLFDKPFKGSNDDRFYGTSDYPDVLINNTTAYGRTFLAQFNGVLFPTQEQGTGQNPRVTEIRVFAPPVIGALIMSCPACCYDATGVRYGLATIQVTAQKFTPAEAADTTTPSTRALAIRTVQMVVSEWPFPGPQGPIQSNANIQTGGNFGVHWGRMTAQGNMEIKIPLVGLNWYDAWDHTHFEHGYDSSDPWSASTNYLMGQAVHPTAASGSLAFVATNNGKSGPAEPTWPTALPAADFTETGGTVTWHVRAAMSYPNQSAGAEDQFNWFYELLGQTYEDPWFEARARGDVTNIAINGDTGPHPYAYTDPTKVPTNKTTPGYSNWLQWQTRSDPKPSDYKQVIFPKIDYNFWKDIAVSGQGNQGVYYLRYAGTPDLFTDGITTKKMVKWVNTVNGAPAGFYFFDTQNQQNPQGPGAPGTMTPAFSVNAADDGPTIQMQGFIYLNATEFGTTGVGGPVNWYNFPGEPFRDVGYRRAAILDDTVSVPNQAAGKIWVGQGGDTPPLRGATNGVWDFQDLPWSNSGKDGTGGPASYATATNNSFDLYLKSVTVPLRQTGSTTTIWVPVEWYPGCHPGTNAVLDASGVDPLGCSEPHEPYLNLQYPQAGANLWGQARSGGGASAVPTGFFAPNLDIRLAKVTDSSKIPVACTASSTQGDCTSNAYDRDGPISNDIQPILDGIFYLEGDFDATGNAPYFGSLLINGNVGLTGTPEVWFDEKLIKDEWPPKRFNFPRVYISAVKTD
jgi:hypothetical protein